MRIKRLNVLFPLEKCSLCEQEKTIFRIKSCPICGRKFCEECFKNHFHGTPAFESLNDFILGVDVYDKNVQFV